MPGDGDQVDDGWRTALSESFDKVVASEAPIGAPPAPAETSSPAEAAEATPSTESAVDGRERDEKGRFKPGAASKGNEAPRASSSGAQAGAASGAPTAAAPPGAAPAAPPAPVSDLKPPQSWKPAVRELAAKLPAEFRPIIEEAVRRDREAAVAMQAKAEAEKGAGSWQETVRPYEAQIRATGAQPQQYVGDLLKTAHALTYSAPQQKADMMAGLIMQFGITPQDLDSALVAKMQGRAQAPQPQQELRDPRLDQLLQNIQAQEDAKIEARSAKFAETHDYFEDVADDMVATLEGWKSQGKDHSSDEAMEKAYRMACQANDDVSKLLAQKKAAESAANAQASTQRAKAAASSVRSTPGGASGSAPPADDWRSHLEAAWDRQSGQ